MTPPDQPKLRLKDRRRRLLWIKVAAGTSVIAFSFALLFFVSRLPAITIAEVQVTGTSLVHAEEVQQLALTQMDGSYGYLIPRANAFLVPIGAMTAAIAHSFPAVAHVSVSRKSFTSLAVAITERQEVALWCGETASSSDCYGMDSGGFIFTKDAGTKGLVAYYGPVSGSPIGSTYLGGGFAALAETVKDIGTSINHTPKEVLVDNGNMDVSLTFAEGGVLRFIRTTDRQTTLENVASVFASQGFKTHSQFEYVDFRFGDKVYVKFK